MTGTMQNAAAWRLEVASHTVREARSRPRDLREFQDFYRLWSRPVFAFCLLVCGDRTHAEWLTEESFAWYFRRADFVALRRREQIPVALLRSAADLAKSYGGRRLDAASSEFKRAVLELPFKERASFILVSVLGVQSSTAAVALRLSSSQLASCWLEAALRLHGLRLGSGDSPAMQPAA